MKFLHKQNEDALNQNFILQSPTTSNPTKMASPSSTSANYQKILKQCKNVALNSSKARSLCNNNNNNNQKVVKSIKDLRKSPGSAEMCDHMQSISPKLSPQLMKGQFSNLRRNDTSPKTFFLQQNANPHKIDRSSTKKEVKNSNSNSCKTRILTSQTTNDDQPLAQLQQSKQHQCSFISPKQKQKTTTTPNAHHRQQMILKKTVSQANIYQYNMQKTQSRMGLAKEANNVKINQQMQKTNQQICKSSPQYDNGTRSNASANAYNMTKQFFQSKSQLKCKTENTETKDPIVQKASTTTQLIQQKNEGDDEQNQKKHQSHVYFDAKLLNILSFSSNNSNKVKEAQKEASPDNKDKAINQKCFRHSNKKAKYYMSETSDIHQDYFLCSQCAIELIQQGQVVHALNYNNALQSSKNSVRDLQSFEQTKTDLFKQIKNQMQEKTQNSSLKGSNGSCHSNEDNQKKEESADEHQYAKKNQTVLKREHDDLKQKFRSSQLNQFLDNMSNLEKVSLQCQDSLYQQIGGLNLMHTNQLSQLETLQKLEHIRIDKQFDQTRDTMAKHIKENCEFLQKEIIMRISNNLQEMRNIRDDIVTNKDNIINQMEATPFQMILSRYEQKLAAYHKYCKEDLQSTSLSIITLPKNSLEKQEGHHQISKEQKIKISDLGKILSQNQINIQQPKINKDCEDVDRKKQNKQNALNNLISKVYNTGGQQQQNQPQPQSVAVLTISQQLQKQDNQLQIHRDPIQKDIDFFSLSPPQHKTQPQLACAVNKENVSPNEKYLSLLKKVSSNQKSNDNFYTMLRKKKTRVAQQQNYDSTNSNNNTTSNQSNACVPLPFNSADNIIQLYKDQSSSRCITSNEVENLLNNKAQVTMMSERINHANVNANNYKPSQQQQQQQKSSLKAQNFFNMIEQKLLVKEEPLLSQKNPSNQQQQQQQSSQQQQQLHVNLTNLDKELQQKPLFLSPHFKEGGSMQNGNGNKSNLVTLMTEED